MIPQQIEKNTHFIGRTQELNWLQQIALESGSKILVVYGRRRVGKTELLEQAYRERGILKFEGQEGLAANLQMQFVMHQLAKYAEEPILKKVSAQKWVDVLECIAERVSKGKWTIYFEEVQWLANYQDEFISALKYVWDNGFRRNPELLLILCGSSPSFMINRVLHSKALYNRSQYTLPVREFNLLETRQLLSKHALPEVMDAYLTVGGMPEYLLRLKKKQSVYLTLCEESFLPGAFFSHEYERIFTSSLARNPNYKKIIDFLAKRKYAARSEILQHLKLNSGGRLTTLLLDLEQCGFIERYTPFNKPTSSLLSRYTISDAYLQYYFKLIAPLQVEIDRGNFRQSPSRALNTQQYQQWLGYSFERFCRKYHRQIAALLGFAAVRYQVGPYFNRGDAADEVGCQIDLVFDRADKVITICEIKYQQVPTSTKVIEAFEKKLERSALGKGKTLQRVLISNAGADDALKQRHYFDYILTLEDLFKEHIWLV